MDSGDFLSAITTGPCWMIFISICHISHFYVLCNSDQMKNLSFEIPLVKCPVTSGKTAIILLEKNTFSVSV